MPNRKWFLNKLIDKYENSQLSKVMTTRQLKIAFPFNKETIKEYFDETNFSRIDHINQECLYLESKQFIKIVFKNASYIQNIELNIGFIDEVYHYLNRNPKKDLEQNVLDVLFSYVNHGDLLGRFSMDMIDHLKAHKSIKRYLDVEKLDDVKDILKALDYVFKQETEILKRKFSVLLFRNSKRFEQIENKVIKILRDYALVPTGDDVLAEYNIISNPSYVYLKGNGVFKCNEETIDLKKLGAEISFNTNVIDKLEVVSISAKRIITIENLTSFYEYQTDEDLVIYLGGFHNTIRRNLLKKLFHFKPNIPFFHWGDIDLGGFEIYNHLRDHVSILIHPLNMDLETLKKHREYAMDITDRNYLTKLERLLNDPRYEQFYEVIEYMIKHQIRLEQESIIIK